MRVMMTRREAMARIGALLLASPAPDSMMEDMVRTSFRYFWEAADPNTGLVKDRALADGQ